MSGSPSAAAVLFHWSPSSRRKQIARYGLRPGSRSTCGLWKPPYIALSDSPSLAWMLSGATERGREHPMWDLWQVWTDELAGYEALPFDDDPDVIKECRVYERIYKRDIWYVGTRQREETSSG